MIYQFFPDQSEPVISEHGTLPSIACTVSSDGLRWTVTDIPFVNQFVEHCSFIRHLGHYIVHSQVFCGTDWSAAYAEGGTAGGRTGIAHWTDDFDRWPDVWNGPLLCRSRSTQPYAVRTNPTIKCNLGVGATSFGNVCVGLYGLWRDRAEFGEISCSLGLVVSNDSIRFREVGATPGQPFIRCDESLVTSVPERTFPTIFCQGNGIINVGYDAFVRKNIQIVGEEARIR